MQELIRAEKYISLVPADQLAEERAAGNVFQGHVCLLGTLGWSETERKRRGERDSETERDDWSERDRARERGRKGKRERGREEEREVEERQGRRER